MKRLWALLTGTSLALAAGNAAAYVVDVYETSAPSISTLAEADALVAGGGLTHQGFVYQVNLDDLGDTTQGLFGANQPWPGGANTTFAARVQGSFVLDTGGSWLIGINHDDGARLTIDGVHVLVADGVADNRNTFFSSLALAAGVHTVDIVFFENGGGASLEFFGRAPGTSSLILLVPEPGILALLSLGLLVLGFRNARGKNPC